MELYILRDIRQALGLEENDRSRDKEIEAMTAKEQFEHYCTWNGLLGWSEKLSDVVLELFIEEDPSGDPFSGGLGGMQLKD